MRTGHAVVLFFATLCFLFVGSIRAQEGGQAIEPLRKDYSQSAAKKSEPALEEYNKALEAIKKGNEAQAKGNSDDAYCLYDEAVMRLNGIKGRYPDWERDKVMQQIKNVLEVKTKLVAVVCKEHEEMKEARFRFLVWQRQVAILRKLDIVMEKLEDVEKQVDENRKDIRDIRDKLFER
jgi:hypothetical protein